MVKYLFTRLLKLSRVITGILVGVVVLKLPNNQAIEKHVAPQYNFKKYTICIKFIPNAESCDRLHTRPNSISVEADPRETATDNISLGESPSHLVWYSSFV